MRIHHVTVPARDPERVANVLAEILGARVVPIPHPTGTLLVYAGDADGTAIEVWPAGARAKLGEPDLRLTDLPLPEDWPHHAYVSSDACDADRILAVFAREGWNAERVRNGPPGARLQPGARHDREPHRHRARRRRHARRVRTASSRTSSGRRQRHHQHA